MRAILALSVLAGGAVISHAGVLSAVNDDVDNAVIACIKANPLTDAASRTGDDFDFYKTKCDAEFRASMRECMSANHNLPKEVSKNTACAMGVLNFITMVIDGQCLTDPVTGTTRCSPRYPKRK